MRSIRQHLTYTKAAATLAVFLAAGGAAWAASSLQSRPIHACYKRHGGALRIAGRCKHGERPLSWNQVGPVGATGVRGATGKTGKAGAQGLPGVPGPSDVYAAGQASGPLSASYSSFGKLSVPAGSYLIEAKATFVAEGAAKSTSAATCALAPEPTSATHWDAAAASGEPKSEDVLSLIGAKPFTAAQTIELVCKASAGAGKLENTRLVAIKTAALGLHGETPGA
jgi:hypothetical protein